MMSQARVTITVLFSVLVLFIPRKYLRKTLGAIFLIIYLCLLTSCNDCIDMVSFFGNGSLFPGLDWIIDFKPI